MSLRILVADDVEVVRCGLRVGLAPFEIEVVGEAADGNEFLSLLEQLTCDVALVDLRMPNCDGFQVLKKLRDSQSSLPVVVMSGYENPHFMATAMRLGAKGFVTKAALLPEFARTLQAVFQGHETFTRDNSRRMTGALATQRLGIEYDVSLTYRECEVLGYLGQGLTNKSIAESMKISYETVKEHVQHILQKIGVVDRTQAVYWGMRVGLIQVTPPPGN